MKIKDIYNAFFINKLVVDLGSDTIKIGCPLRGLLLEESSLLMIEGTNVVAIGEDAKRRIGKTPKNSEIIRPIKGSKINDFDAAEVMIEYFLKKINKTHRNKFYIPSPNVIVAVSSKLNAIEERNIKDLFFKIGCSKVFLISQTLLSAIGSGINIYSGNCQFCLNVGSENSEFIIINNGNIIDKKILNFGGHSITKNIISEILSKEQILISYQLAENLKREFVDIKRENDYKEIEIVGQDKTFNTPKKINIKLKSINNIVLLSIRKILDEFISILNKTSPEIIVDLHESGMFLFGGTSKMPYLKNYIEKVINTKIGVSKTKINPVIVGGFKIHRGEYIDDNS